MGCLPVPVLESQGAGSGHRWRPCFASRGGPGSPGDEAGRGAGRVLPRGSNRRRGAQTGVPGALLAHPGRPSAPPQTAAGGRKVSFWRTCAHNFHIAYIRFVCSLWPFLSASPRPVGVCAKARILRGSVRQVRQRGVPQPREAANRGTLGRSECATGAPERPGSAPRRLAEVRSSPNLRPDQHQHRHERQAQGEERPHVFASGECAQCARAPIWCLSNGCGGWREWLAIRASTSRSRAFTRRASAFCSRCARADASPLTPVRTYVVCLYRTDDGRGGPP